MFTAIHGGNGKNEALILSKMQCVKVSGADIWLQYFQMEITDYAAKI